MFPIISHGIFGREGLIWGRCHVDVKGDGTIVCPDLSYFLVMSTQHVEK